MAQEFFVVKKRDTVWKNLDALALRLGCSLSLSPRDGHHTNRFYELLRGYFLHNSIRRYLVFNARFCLIGVLTPIQQKETRQKGQYEVRFFHAAN